MIARNENRNTHFVGTALYTLSSDAVTLLDHHNISTQTYQVLYQLLKSGSCYHGAQNDHNYFGYIEYYKMG
jgi:hypothetical protein